MSLLVGVETVGRFVKQQYRRIAQNALSKADAAQISFGKRFDFLLQNLRNIGCFRSLGNARCGQPAQLGHIAQKVPDAQVRIQRRALRQEADRSLGGQRVVADVAAEDENVSGRGRKIAGYHVHQS